MPRRTHIDQVFDAVASAPVRGRMVNDIVIKTGLHTSTVGRHLRALVAQGRLVTEPVPTGTRGRPPLRYRPAEAA